MSQVKCYALAAEQQLALQNALDEGDRNKFLEEIRNMSINNLIIGTNQDPMIVSGYIILMQKAIEKWILGIKKEDKKGEKCQ